jgi:hypothetical protein
MSCQHVQSQLAHCWQRRVHPGRIAKGSILSVGFIGAALVAASQQNTMFIRNNAIRY